MSDERLARFPGAALVRSPGTGVDAVDPVWTWPQFTVRTTGQVGRYDPCMAAKRVLFLAAEPSDGVRLRLGQEQREIRSVLRLASDRDSIEFHDRFAVRPADFTQALHDIRPQILHFSGHGSRRGDLCFENDSGLSETVDPEALASLFQLVSQDVEAVVLNACYSQLQASAIGRSIQYVIGMSNAIKDDAAIRFSAGFYKALSAGRSFQLRRSRNAPTRNAGPSHSSVVYEAIFRSSTYPNKR